MAILTDGTHLVSDNARNRAIHNGARLVSPKAILQALLDAPYNTEYGSDVMPDIRPDYGSFNRS